jgi:hypothetical protein
MAVIHAQAVRKSRRETPLDWACSQMVGLELVDMMGWLLAGLIVGFTQSLAPA